MTPKEKCINCGSVVEAKNGWLATHHVNGYKSLICSATITKVEGEVKQELADISIVLY
jgi:hypothetical protein